MENTNTERLIVCLSDLSVFSYMNPDETEVEALERAKKFYTDEQGTYANHFLKYGKANDPDDYWKKQLEAINKKVAMGYTIMTYDEYKKKYYAHMLSSPMTEITEEKFEEMLDVLPPKAWVTIDNVEEFCMSEFYHMSLTTQYAHDKITGKYWCKLVDFCDKSTWIHSLLRKE